jgi:WD40 repeat protein
VVIMDFGLARQEAEGGGTVSGTPAYMAPEQAAGQTLDARADVYAAGVVLAEMVSPEGIRSFESRQDLWEGVRAEPARVPDTPWAPVLKRAVARDREGRYRTAHTLTRALEEVTLRVEGAEDLHPYPGLASFTEDDAEYFFGREAEVEQMWRRLEGTPRLLALVGPSGAGKTSFLQAGLVATAGTGRACLICKPGNNPQLALSRALAPEMAGDVEAMDLLLRFDQPEVATEVMSRWRGRSGQAVLIVDQFEELFTQCGVEQQRRFAELLACIVLDSDVHVLLSLRDDFLLRCHDHEALAPVFAADLTPLRAPAGAALRRALVRPATTCGYRFEDDDLVEEMLAEVEGERGALPLLAFAAARLWELRDRDSGLLTREAYREIGGVGGALAQHAEATIERVGMERIPVVRELFRNLVTAEGTRAVREWDELLSVFDDSQREPAETVLRELIDARLLTSYEVREEDSEPFRRVEIIHESLLASWPRLVRWQTQDADAAQLRDQLRQAARTWEDHDRSDDSLWSGAMYREFASWRERYPGGLTDTEEAFARAMTALAGRRRRRRRLAVAAVLVVAAAVAAVTTALWRRSVHQERRAEAQKLIAIGQLRLQDYPTATVAYAISSLELADSEQARSLALEALWQGPAAFVVNEGNTILAEFSPDGEWLVQTHGDRPGPLTVISRNGEQRVMDRPPDWGSGYMGAWFGRRNELFWSRGVKADRGRLGFWSAAEARLLATAKPIEDLECFLGAAVPARSEEARALFMLGHGDLLTIEALNADGSHQRLGEHAMTNPILGEEFGFPLTKTVGQGSGCLAGTGEWFAVVDGNEVFVVDIEPGGLSEPRLLGRHGGDQVPGCRADPLGRFLLTTKSRSGKLRRWDPSGMLAPKDVLVPQGAELRELSRDGAYMLTGGTGKGDLWIWSMDEAGATLARRFNGVVQGGFPVFDPAGLHLANRGPPPAHRLWPLAAPAGARPLVLRSGPAGLAYQPGFSPDGQWLATGDDSGLAMWPLVRPFPAVIEMDIVLWSYGVAFAPDGRFLATAAHPEVRVWPLAGPVPPAGRVVFEAGEPGGVVVSPDGELFVVGGQNPPGRIWIGRAGEEPQLLADADELRSGTTPYGFSPDGRFVAASDGLYEPATMAIHVWEVATRERVAVLRPEKGWIRGSAGFASDGRLLICFTYGVVAWDVETGEQEVLVEAQLSGLAASDDGQRLLLFKAEADIESGGLSGYPVFLDLDTGQEMTLSAFGEQVGAVALDRDGTMLVTGDDEGIIRVGPVTGEQPHILLGHEGAILDLAVDPLGRWIASASVDKTVRLWPMPDLEKPPLHTLPREQLIAKLETLTNLRLVRDPSATTGWTLTHDPFPGWHTPPTW